MMNQKNGIVMPTSVGAKVQRRCGSKGASLFGHWRAHFAPRTLVVAESVAIYFTWTGGCTSTRGPGRGTHGCAYG
jgi:hypothetical protein